MTLETVFLTLVTAYLVLVAYGVVGARRRHVGRAKLIAEALLVILPPALIAGALAAAGEGALVTQWWRLFALMLVAGAVVAIVAEQVARRVVP